MLHHENDIDLDDDASLHEHSALAELPNELVDCILSHLPIRDLVRVSIVCQTWHKSALLIYRNRVLDGFREDGPFRYVFEASQPAENAIQGNILKLRDKSVGLSNEELIVPLTYTAFDFSSREAASTNVYKFTLEADTFIQLCILGNIIQPRKGGGLEGVAQHLDDFCRIKPEYIDISLGDIRTFKINDHCLLTVRLLARDGHTTDYESEEGPVNYEIEFRSLLINSAHLLDAVERYIQSSLSSTALVLRTWA